MSDLVGKSLGKYQIIERVGQGGMAEVYRAFQPGLDRYVAIKVVHSFLLEDESFLTRFRREAQSVADLRHPNIIQVFDFDIQDQRPYMVLEFINGVNLGDVIDHRIDHERTLELSEVLWLMQALCSAVGYAHKQGIVHRDIKPANVMLTTDQRVILADFGLVRILGGAKFTATGQVTGTPEYMSPEQAHGAAGDQRSDIYALGILFFEALTSCVPYNAETPVAILLKHVSYPVPDIFQLKPDLPPTLGPVIDKVLAKNPEDRYQTAEDFWNDIQEACPDIGAPGKLLPNSAGQLVDRSGASHPQLVQSQPTQVYQQTPTVATNQPDTIRVGWNSRLSATGVILLILNLLAIGVVGYYFYAPDKPEPPVAVNAGKGGTTTLPAEAVNALVDTGNNQLQAADFSVALDTFNIVLKQEPKSVSALLGRALANVGLAKFENAKKDIADASRAAPNDPRPRLLEARITLQQNPEFSWASVKAQIDSATLLAPSLPESLFTRGWSTLYFEPLSDATKIAGPAFSCLPDWGKASAPGRAAHSIQDLQRAVDLAPGQRDYRLALSDALFFSGNLTGAREQTQAALNIAPGYFPGLWRQGALAIFADDFSTGTNAFTSILGSPAGRKESGLWFAARAFSLLRAGKIEESLKDVEASLGAASGNPSALFVKAMLLGAQGKTADAKLVFEQLQSANRESLECPIFNSFAGKDFLAEWGMLLNDNKDFKGGLEKCDELIKQQPKFYLGFYCRGVARAGLKQAVGAREDFDAALTFARSEVEKAHVREGMAKHVPKPTPTPTPASTPGPKPTPVTEKTPTPTPLPTVPVVSGSSSTSGDSEALWGSASILNNGTLFRDTNVDAKNIAKLSWTLKITGVRRGTPASIEQRLRSGVKVKVFDPAQRRHVIELAADEVSGEGNMESPAIAAGTLKSLESLVPKVIAEQWSAPLRIDFEFGGQILAKKELRLSKIADTRRDIEAAKVQEQEPEIPKIREGAEQERYVGRLMPNESGRQSLSIDLQLEFKDGAASGSADIEGLGRFVVSGQVFPRGMELQLTRGDQKIRMSVGPRGSKIRGRYGYPAANQQGSMDADRK